MLEIKVYQKWYCEECGRLGEIQYQKNESPFEVIRKIQDQHHELSADCKMDINNIRVINESHLIPKLLSRKLEILTCPSTNQSVGFSDSCFKELAYLEFSGNGLADNYFTSLW